MAGIVKHGCFTMLTTKAGPDVKPYCKRQPCILSPSEGLDWLALMRPQKNLLRSRSRGTLTARTKYETTASLYKAQLPRQADR